MSTPSTEKMLLSSAMQQNLDSLGYRELTPIQRQCIPLILQGDDLIAQSKTGSGKTAAFGIALLEKLDLKKHLPQSLILCPTRELSAQVALELRRLARFSPNIKILELTGGSPLSSQRDSLRHGAHILVATPGRLIDHLGKGTLDLESIRYFVLDEADRMLDMGFLDAIGTIRKALHSPLQTLLFSATYPDTIGRLSQSIQHAPVHIKVESEYTLNPIDVRCFKVSDPERHFALFSLIDTFVASSAIIFCNTRDTATALAKMLQQEGYSALSLHGELDQVQRHEILTRFANRSCNLLVTTDLTARGIDVEAVDTVINYEMPLDPEVYVHRIGRTGRAGLSGRAVNLIGPKERASLKRIETYMHVSYELEDPQHALNASCHIRQAPMQTLIIFGGKKQKLRPGDIVGALINETTLTPEAIGKIHRFDTRTYVAISRELASNVFNTLPKLRIKGKSLKTLLLD